LVSVVHFGSTASGGLLSTASDVDLILVVADGTSSSQRTLLRDRIVALEIHHGLRADSAQRKPIEAIFDRITANDHTFFMCARGDLLSGNVARILNVSSIQARFVDRIVMTGILSSGVTLLGEHLTSLVSLPPIRRFDVLKSFFGLYSQAVTIAALYPALPAATRYAMGALKRSVHNCYFCYHGRTAALEAEVEFFIGHRGPVRSLRQLMELRAAYRPSFAFTLRCLTAMVRLHARTAWDFPFR